MKLLITPSNPNYSFIVLDTETKEEHRVSANRQEFDYGADSTRFPHRPFGITWDRDFIYVANRRFLCIYTHELKYVGKSSPILGQNPHQIIFDGKDIVSTITCSDCIAFTNKDNNWSTKYFHIPSNTFVKSIDDLKDTKHINSLLKINNYLFILAHNKGIKHSEILVFSYEKNQIIGDIPLVEVFAGHNLFYRNTFGCLSTHTNSIFNYSKSVSLNINPHFLRGLSYTSEDLAYAFFLPEARSSRNQGDSHITTSQGTITLKDIGAVNDMRSIDKLDYSHLNTIPLCY